MRAFAVAWPDEDFVQGVLAQLPWFSSAASIAHTSRFAQRDRADLRVAKSGRHCRPNRGVQNGWAVREFRRQVDVSLYERLALSRDKAELKRLATEGQVVERAADL